MTTKEDLIAKRKQEGFTQLEAARFLGVSKRTYESWEYGTRIPKQGYESAVTTLTAFGMLTKEEIEAVLSGEMAMTDLSKDAKLRKAKKLARCGRQEYIYAKYLSKIPEDIVNVLSAEQIAKLIDILEDTFNAGVNYQK